MLTFRPFIRENGQVPGPNLIVWKNQTIITVSSQLQIQTVSIHWHGMQQYNMHFMDGIHHAHRPVTTKASTSQSRSPSISRCTCLCSSVMRSYTSISPVITWTNWGFQRDLWSCTSPRILIDKQLFPLYEAEDRELDQASEGA